MRNLTRRAAVITVAAAAGVLALGGVTAAWAGPAPSHGGPPTHGAVHHGKPPISGTVASVGSGSFRLTEQDGASVTVDVNSSTNYSETGTQTAPTGVTVGERVFVLPVSGTTSGTSTVTASRVVVTLIQVSGTVTSVGSGSFNVHLQGGLTTTVDTTGSTTYSDNGTTKTGVTTGQSVTAFGTPDATDPTQLDAQFVDIHTAPTTGSKWNHGGWPAHQSWTFLSGTVASVGSGSFQLTEQDGSSVTVDVNSSTKYSETGTRMAPTGVTAGERVFVLPVSGTTSKATTVTASRVVVMLIQVSGTVTSVGSGSFNVQSQGGLTTTVDTTGATTYSKNGTTESGVSDGQSVTAFGTPDATDPTQLDALFVDIHAAPTHGSGSNHRGRPVGPGSNHGSWPRGPVGPGGTHQSWAVVTGMVHSVTSDDVVVTGPSGSTTTVVVSSTTRYLGSSGSKGLAALTDGVTVTAFGSKVASGDIDAIGVFIGTLPTMHPAGAPGFGTWPGPGSAGGNRPPTPASPSTGGSFGGRGRSGATSPSTPTAPSGSRAPGGSHVTGGRGQQGPQSGASAGGRGPQGGPGS